MSTDLKGFVEQVTGSAHLRVEDDLGCGYVRLLSAEAERRQAKHDVRSTEDIVIEMLRNARDAEAKHIFLATNKEEGMRKIVMLDDGCGIPVQLHEKIFEARVTSKLDSVHFDTWGIHGRGMALFAIKENSTRAYVALSDLGLGTALFVETDTSVLKEKADQSSKPVFSLTESGTVVVRGPRNICRTVTEFAYIDRDQVTVFLGSPVEIAATLWDFGMRIVPKSERIFSDGIDTVPVVKRLAYAHTPAEFAQIATDLGIELSERSARRIMEGQIEPLEPIADTVELLDAKGKPVSKGDEDEPEPAMDPFAVLGLKGRTKMRLDKADIGELEQAVVRSWRKIAPKYYLEPHISPRVKVRNGKVSISFAIDRLD